MTKSRTCNFSIKEFLICYGNTKSVIFVVQNISIGCYAKYFCLVIFPTFVSVCFIVVKKSSAMSSAYAVFTFAIYHSIFFPNQTVLVVGHNAL